VRIGQAKAKKPSSFLTTVRKPFNRLWSLFDQLSAESLHATYAPTCIGDFDAEAIASLKIYGRRAGSINRGSTN
jgi:hypothetical protein